MIILWRQDQKWLLIGFHTEARTKGAATVCVTEKVSLMLFSLSGSTSLKWIKAKRNATLALGM